MEEARISDEPKSYTVGDAPSATAPLVPLQTVGRRPEEELTVAELGADGRVLQETGQGITTDIEMIFTTDVEVWIVL